MKLYGNTPENGIRDRRRKDCTTRERLVKVMALRHTLRPTERKNKTNKKTVWRLDSDMIQMSESLGTEFMINILRAVYYRWVIEEEKWQL